MNSSPARPSQTADLGLRISEINYHPGQPTRSEIAAGFDDANDFEFLELLNTSDNSIDLSQVEFRRTAEDEGIAFAFSEGAVAQLAPGERVVVVEDLAAFQLRYGAAIAVAGEWSGQLSNGGEALSLVVNAAPMLEFRYDDAWHPSTDGEGFTLELVDPLNPDRSTLNSKEAWRPSSRPGGSPGTAGRPVAGDSNGDGIFDSADLVLVFQIGEYEDGIPGNSTFEQGDWDGDGDFTTADFVFAFQQGTYTSEAGRAASRRRARGFL